MKKSLILFMYLLIYCQLYSQESILNTESWNSLNLSEQVKSLKETSFNAKKTTAGIVKSTKGWQYEFENDSELYFDTLGNLLFENKVLPSKKEVVYSIRYDSIHRIVNVSRSSYTHYFTYDSLNRIISSKKENYPAGTNSKTEQVTRFIYHYNDENLVSKIESFNDQSGVSIETFQYDPSKKMILSELTKGGYTETHHYQYNEDLQLIKEEWKNNEGGILETTTYTYKGKEKIQEHWVDYEAGKPDGSIDDIFERGNIVKTVEADPDGTVAVLEFCTYQFDTKGNWIKKTIHCDEKYYIVERIIEYY